MAQTRVVATRVPDELFHGARQALGLPASATGSDVIRHALAEVASLDVADHTPIRTGRPPRRRSG